MKNALSWRGDEPLFYNAKWTPETVVRIIKEIQLDAYKQGMKDAAEIARKCYGDPAWSGHYQRAGESIAEYVEIARDSKTLKDL